MSLKRSAERQLTKDTREEGIDVSLPLSLPDSHLKLSPKIQDTPIPFQKANEDILAGRRIRGLPKSRKAAFVSGAPAAGPDSEAKPSPFGGLSSGFSVCFCLFFDFWRSDIAG